MLERVGFSLHSTAHRNIPGSGGTRADSNVYGWVKLVIGDPDHGALRIDGDPAQKQAYRSHVLFKFAFPVRTSGRNRRRKVDGDDEVESIFGTDV